MCSTSETESKQLRYPSGLKFGKSNYGDAIYQIDIVS